jgi:VanZ family protein
LHWLRRNILEVVTAAYALVVLWGGLVPFDFSLHPHAFNGQFWFGLPVQPPHWADLASNAALFLPLGALIRATLWKRGWWPIVSLVVSIAICAAMTYGIEVTQLASQKRVSSAADFGANLLGALAGVVLMTFARSAGFVFRDALWSVSRRWRESLIERPSAVMAQLCAVFLFLSAVSPFDVTFAPNLVYESVSESHLIPFTNDARLSATITNTRGDADGRSESRQRNDRWQRTFDYASTAAGFGLLAILICHYLKNHCKVIGRQRALWCLQACLLLALFSSGAQLFVLSRSLDTTDILMALVGASMGMMVADRCAMAWARTGGGGQSSNRVTLLRAACVTLFVAVIARELAPFQFAVDSLHVRGQLGDVELLPFKAYQTARLPVAVEDILAKFCRLALLGAALTAWRCRGKFSKDMGRLDWAAMGVGALVAALEVLQILLPARTPAMTDVLLAVVGAASGVALLRMAVAIRISVETYTFSTIDQPLFNVTFDDADTAPQERVPTSDEPSAPFH